MGIIVKKTTRNIFITLASITGLVLAISVRFFWGGIDFMNKKIHSEEQKNDSGFSLIKSASADMPAGDSCTYDCCEYYSDNCGGGDGNEGE